MKHINCEISDESYEVIIKYKIYKNLKKLENALDPILKEYKKLKGG